MSSIIQGAIVVKDLIQKLVEAWGPSGYEHHVRALIQAEVQPFVDEMTVDALGNLICRVGSGPKKIMMAAHMDEIGIMVTFREPKSGYLRFAGLGGLIQTTLHGNRVRFEDGTVGVVAAPDAFGASRTTAPDLDSFYIDVTDGSTADAITPGCPAVFWRPMESRGSRLISKSMDDRVGCAVAIETMRRLQKQTPHSLYFVFTVQEEVGIRGARPAAFSVEPDLAIALDVCPTGDEIKGERNAVKLGGGAAIKLQDTGVIVPPAVRDWMVNRAEADKIPYQFELIKAGTTDAAGIQVARAGVPSGCISIPCRYVHTTSETVDLADVEACVGLLTGLLSHAVSI
ncbi:MAG: M20/M25/M40 family metallo-hydrolase [Anaerolineae bacterium]|nr:M20/M25/M40 family metallo-hydrolase [Anaerolineae bacterium]